MSEATSPLADPSRADGWHYVGNESPRMDQAARAVGLSQDAYYKKYPDISRAGHLWYATRVDD